MQVKAKYTSVLVQYDVRRSQHKQKDERTTQRSTKQTKQNKNQQQTTPTHRTTRRADATQQNEGAGGRKQAETSKQGKSRRPGRQQRQEGESSTSQEGGHVQLYRCPKGILDHPRANTSVPERGAQHPPHGVEEGKAHTGPKTLLPGSGVKTGANQPRHAMPKV